MFGLKQQRRLLRPVLCRLCQANTQLSRSNQTTTATGFDGHPKPPPLEHKFYNLMSKYEDIIGLSAVKQAQTRTLEMERLFINAQEERKSRQDDLKRVQMRLKEIHAELDKTSRGEDRYLSLLTDEHKLIKEERMIIEDVKSFEHDERLKFQALSAFLRESHEKEREQAEKTKYWSIIGSICGALIGIIGTTIGNRMKMKELRGLVTDGDSGRTKQLMQDLTDMFNSQQMQVRSFMGDMRAMLAHQSVVSPAVWHAANEDQGGANANSMAVNFDDKTTETVILDAIKAQDEKLEHDMHELKQMVAKEYGYKQDAENSQTLVYVGPDMSRMLNATASELEAKMKMQTVIAVVAVYTALALALPIVFALSRAG